MDTNAVIIGLQAEAAQLRLQADLQKYGRAKLALEEAANKIDSAAALIYLAKEDII